jgi:N utilization substance protein A
VTVPEDQLSLAIGWKGQNVRLAVKMTGWDIDIVPPEPLPGEEPEEEAAEETEAEVAPEPEETAPEAEAVEQQADEEITTGKAPKADAVETQEPVADGVEAADSGSPPEE